MNFQKFRPIIGPSLYGIPSRNVRCLCGSGKRFKQCCAGLWRDSDFREAHRKTSPSEISFETIRSIRAEITWYRICHERHTRLLLEAGNELGNEILALDIDALFDLASTMLRYLRAMKHDEGRESFLSALGGFVRDPRWNEKCALLSILDCLGEEWDEIKAKNAVLRLGALDQYSDPELLMVAIDVVGDELSFDQAYKICQRIEDAVTDPYYKLHYGTLGAVLLLKVSDRKGAAERVSSVIERFDSQGEDLDEAGPYELAQVASSMSLADTLLPQRGFDRRAIIAVNKLIDCGRLTASGLAHAYLRKAWQLRDMGDVDGAIESFRHAFAKTGDHVALVFEAECEAIRGNVARAVLLLSTVEPEKLHSSGFADFAFISARCAVSLRNGVLMDQSRDRLRSLVFSDSLFEIERLNLLHEIELAVAMLPAQGANPRVKFLELFSRYTELKPNLFGLGLNLNAMLEDLSEKRSMRIRKGDD